MARQTYQSHSIPPDMLAKIRDELVNPAAPREAQVMTLEEDTAHLSAIPNSQPTLTTQGFSPLATRAHRDPLKQDNATSQSSPGCDANSRRRAAKSPSAGNLRVPKIGLSKSTTVPNIGGSQPESQAHAQRRMLQSFGGFDLETAEGDTQPIETQYFKELTTSIIGPEEDAYFTRANEFDNVHAHGADAEDLIYNEDEAMDLGAPRTWDEDDGEDAEEHNSSFDINAELDGMSPQTQHRLQEGLSQVSPPVSSPKFAMPKTPALAGSKRNYEGDILTSASRATPGSAFGNAFAKTKHAVSLTQIFDGTQCETPRANDLRSDPIFQRPSPDFITARSSPPVPGSSPLQTARTDPARAATEPIETYLSMKESQELRERRRLREAELLLLRSDADVDSDDERTPEERLAQRRRRRAEINRQAMADFGQLTAPKRQSIAHRKTRSLISSDVNYVTPARSNGRRRKQVIEISDGEESASDSSLDELAQGLHMSSQRSRLAPADANGVQVPMTSSRNKQSSAQRAESSPPTSPGPENIEPAVVSTSISKRTGGASQRSEGRLYGTQTVAVADSQPLTRQRGSQKGKSHHPTPLVEPSSMDSIGDAAETGLPAIQDLARLQAIKESLTTSSIPAPPVSSLSPPPEDLDDEQRIPSSPPLYLVDQANDNVNPKEEDFREPMDTSRLDSRPSQPANIMTASQRLQGVTSSQLKQTTAESAPARGDSQKENLQPAMEDADAVSNAATSEGRGIQSSLKDHSVLFGDTDSLSTMPYQTATSHLSRSPRKKMPSGDLESLQVTLEKTPPLLGLTNIAAQSTPGRMNTQDLEMEITTITDKIFTEEDTDFINMMNSAAGSSPVRPSKRRKVLQYSRNSAIKRLSPTKPLKSVSPVVSRTTPSLQEVHAGPTISALPENQQDELSKDEVPTSDAQMVHRTPADEQEDELSKASDSVFDGPVIVRSNSARSTAMHKLKPISKASRSPLPIKLQSKKTSHTIPKSTLPAKSKKPSANDRKKAATREKAVEHLALVDDNELPAKNADRTHNGSEPVQEDDGFVVPSQVFARFKGGPGGNMSYWPAICLNATGSGYRVRFAENIIDTVDSMHVRALDLRAGDLVKVNKDGMRKNFYVVCGLKNKASAEEIGDLEHRLLTDRKGFRNVALQVKSRDSNIGVDSSESPIVVVAIPEVYIPATKWTQFEKRYLTIPADSTVDPLHTPAVSEAPTTPQARTRRPPAGRYAPIPSTSDAIAPMTSPPPAPDGLFSNMSFGVTLSSAYSEDKRDAFNELIRSNGGFLVNPDFVKLFEGLDLPTYHITTNRRSKKTNAQKLLAESRAHTPASSAATNNCSGLVLRPSFAELGFVAVISDGHSKKPRYFQALALGLPCLHVRWVHDCIARSRILPFAPYLLPAGESSLLDNAIRSRTLPGPVCFDPLDHNADLQVVLDKRELLLKDKRVLIALDYKAKTSGRPGFYAFMAYALGARKVERAQDPEDLSSLAAASAESTEPSVDWVIVDTGSVDSASSLLFGMPGSTQKPAAASKKRKRAGEAADLKTEVSSYLSSESKLHQMFRRGQLEGRTVCIASDDFLKQSIILGQLLDE